MKFAFDFVVRMAGSMVIEADDLHTAKIKLENVVKSRGGRELVDLEVIHTSIGPLASMTELDDLKKAIINRK